MKTMRRCDIASGDILAWTEFPGAKLSHYLIKMIAYMTNDIYGHVGVAWRMHDGIEDELITVEATIPRIAISRSTDDTVMHCVPMDIVWTNLNKKFLMDRIGLSYSVADAIRAHLGIVSKKDDRYQCVELAHEFLGLSGYLVTEDLRPGPFVRNLVSEHSKSVYRVI